MDLASFYFGAFLAVFCFTQTKIIQQTRAIWRRTRSIANGYLWMIWIEAWVNFIWAIKTFLFLCGVIPPSLAFFVGTVILWSIQTQLLSQIIANRVALIMVERRKALMLRWGLFISIGLVNIPVCIIWTQAHLPEATPFQVTLNIWFEKAEKSFFLIIDLSLNLFFLYLVRSRLISDGLSKYWKLYHFNAAIVMLSTSMDILLLGFLSLPDPYLYVQFSPLAYIVKLNIEITMAVIISKVARSGSTGKRDGLQEGSSQKTDLDHGTTARVEISGGPKTQDQAHAFHISRNDVEARGGSSSGSEAPLSHTRDEQGIMKTVETMVLVERDEGGRDRYVKM
ncbi:hypothetical protein N658DRAFT_521107 [Parathielavia hyrcaniae]|uniref:Uncharacterized protein n=1 Tax=Parathielavia hyrcaniae TaxID=113614 RepID=A0AAN6Q6F2_9PEZI|nr:hypothetical protein N658DRAFT_521107 [Parathielavia hyrcaniae]